DADRVLPLVAIDQVVPVRDQIVDRTAAVAKRDAAIHAARSLIRKFSLGQRLQELRPRLATHVRSVIAAIVPLDLQEPGYLAHVKTLSVGTHHPAAQQWEGQARSAGEEVPPHIPLLPSRSARRPLA